MGYEYSLLTARRWTSSAVAGTYEEVPIEDELMGWLEEPMGLADLEQTLAAATKQLKGTILAALFVGEEFEWQLFVLRDGEVFQDFPRLDRQDGSPWPLEASQPWVELEGSAKDVAAFEQRFNPYGGAVTLCGQGDGAALEEFAASLAGLAANKEPAIAADWAGSPVGIELCRGRYRLQPLRVVDPTGNHQALLDRMSKLIAPDTGWVSVEPSRRIKSKSSNPLRVGSKKMREKLAKEADRFPSRANVADLIEARFAPEARVASALSLRWVLDRALGRHDEPVLESALRGLVDSCEDDEVVEELTRFLERHPSPGAALRQLADGVLKWE